MPNALITGITGQDGLYLAELLLGKGYNVYGLIRGQNNPKTGSLSGPSQTSNCSPATSPTFQLDPALEVSRPDEVYNLGAISYVAYSWDQALLTSEVTGRGVLNILEAVRLHGADSWPVAAFLPSIVIGDVRQSSCGPADRRNFAVATVALRCRKGVRPLHNDQLPRVLRDACVFRESCSTTSRRVVVQSS